MPIDIQCAGCGKALRVADEHAGKQARCPECGHVTRVSAAAVPGESAGAAAPPPMGGPAGASFGAPAPTATGRGLSDSAGSAEASGGGGSAAASPDNAAGPWHMLTPEGYRYGPVDRAELDRWVTEGRVTPECKLRVDGEGRWRSADEVYPALKSGLAATAAYSNSAGRQVGGMTVAPTQHAAQQNPFADRYQAGPYPAGPSLAATSPQGRPTYYQPHRGVVILVLGILGFVLGGLIGCPILSVIAWFMGSADVAEIRAGRMDPEGMGMTQAGRILGIVYTLMWLAAVVMVVGIFVMMMLCGLAGNL